MNPTNLRDLLTVLDKQGHLKHIKRTVDPIFELGAVVKATKGVQPMLFENVLGCSFPMIVGLGGDRQLLAESLGIGPYDFISKIIDSIVQPIPVTEVRNGPVHENVVKDTFDLKDFFSILKYHAEDSGQYYVSGILVVKDVTGKKQYTSIRRMQYLGGNKTNILITSPELNAQYAEFEKRGEPMEVAVMFGVVPAITLASQLSTHLYHTDKLNIAGALLGESLDVVKCKTVDLEVLADAEIVLEGRMLPHERVLEGPFAELAGYYGGASPQPVIEFSAVTYRNNAINQTIMPASYEEKLPMALAREVTLFTTIKQVIPTIKDVHITLGGIGRYHAIIQIDKKSEGDGKQAALAAFASDKDLKHVVVVNDDVDIHNPEDVEFALATRVQADEDIFIVPGAKGSPLEASHNLRGVTAKMGIDATYPLKYAEQFRRTSIPIKIDLKDYFE